MDPDPKSDPDLVGSESRVRSGTNHFKSGSGQPSLGMNLKQNFSNKIHNFSTKCIIKIKIYFPSKKFPIKLKLKTETLV